MESYEWAKDTQPLCTEIWKAKLDVFLMCLAKQ